MLISVDISYRYLLERVKGNSMLDGDKIIPGINTLWSTLLPVAKYPPICFGYTTCIYQPCMHAGMFKIHKHTRMVAGCCSYYEIYTCNA